MVKTGSKVVCCCSVSTLPLRLPFLLNPFRILLLKTKWTTPFIACGYLTNFNPRYKFRQYVPWNEFVCVSVLYNSHCCYHYVPGTTSFCCCFCFSTENPLTSLPVRVGSLQFGFVFYSVLLPMLSFCLLVTTFTF